MKLNLDRQAMEDKYGDRIVIYSNSNKEEISVWTQVLCNYEFWQIDNPDFSGLN